MSEAIEKLRRFREDFPLFAKSCLKILDKDGKIVPLEFNTPQRIVHEAIEKQKREKGWVRALVLKARKQGVSTYIQARNYHRTTLWPNTHSYILTHEKAASDVIFEIVDRYQRHNPIAPSIGVSNEKELSFEKKNADGSKGGLQSSYTVATAGQKAGGRGGTPRFFHGSEVGFWPNAADHFKGSVNAVPDAPGTEIVLESTANGTQGEFYDRWQDAVAGRGDFIAIFIPWFASPEYYREPEEGFELNKEAEDGELSEVEVAEMFGLSLGQMCWRRAKILAVGGHDAFRQEYPATAEEAFVSATKNSLIDALTVLRARKRKVIAGGPLIIGVDPAGSGGDRFAVAFRRGYRVEQVIWRDKIDTPEALAWLIDIVDEYKPARMFVDQGGLGAPIISMLKSKGPTYRDTIIGINFGAKSQAKNAKPKVAGPKRRRDEMWARMKAWLKQEEGVQIPDMDALQADLTGPWVKNDLNNDLVLSTKEEMKAPPHNLRSPDLADAIALTFAESVWVESKAAPPDNPYTRDHMDTGRVKSYGYSVPPPRPQGNPNGWMS